MSADRTLAEQTARRRRAALAGHDGDIATATALLADPDAVVRATALRALARADGLTVDVLSAAATDEATTVRTAALELVAHRPEPELDAVIVDLLDADEPPVIETAAWAAGERERSIDAVLDRLIVLTTTHADSLVREAAVAALGAIGDPRGLPAILQATEDRATVRRRAVLALAPFDGPAVGTALNAATTDRDWQVRQAAEDLLS